MRTLAKMTLATLVATSLFSGCDSGSGIEEERVLFRLVRDEAPVRIVLDGDENGEGCTVIDIVPDDGVAILKDLCANDQNAATVQLPEGLVDSLEAAALLERIDHSGRIVEIQSVAGERFEVVLTDDLNEAIEAVHEQAEVAGSSSQQVDVNAEKDAPEQTAVGMSADTGFIFGAGSLFEALPTKVDILAYSGSKGMDLVPGLNPVTNEQRRLHLFIDDHGQPVLFNDLHEIPNYVLTEADTDMVRDARKGMAFIVENNVSGGVTYVFVKQVSNTKVELEYQAVK
jgi:hypothetical protein